jgi:hypothetical protein
VEEMTEGRWEGRGRHTFENGKLGGAGEGFREGESGEKGGRGWKGIGLAEGVGV